MMKLNQRARIVKTAAFSRLVVIILQYVSNVLFLDHDAGVYIYIKEDVADKFGDKVVQHLIGGFARWDAQYFLHIAKYGYTYENTVAFFPLFPLLGNILGKCSFLHGILSEDSILLLSFIMINIVGFVYSAVTFYELSCQLIPQRLAYSSTLLFCWNPASIFFSAPYSECLYSALSFKSMLNVILLYKKYHNLQKIIIKDILYLVPIALSGITRSNGVLNTGFFLYMLICIFIKTCGLIKGNLLKRITKKIFLILAFIIISVFTIIFCIFPFDLFQIYCYRLFCTDFVHSIPAHLEKYAEEHNLVLPGAFSKHNQTWCHNKIPLAYSYVQSHYWNVGFLKYYDFKQIPNFLLALPILALFFYNCTKFLMKNPPKPLSKIFDFDIFLPKSNNILENTNLYVFIIHGLALSLFCLFFMHIQVSTRFLCSASPLMYWFSANHLSIDGKFCGIKKFKYLDRLKKYIILYYASYFVVGTALFSNFFPWT